MKIYTRTGDDGSTAFFGGGRVSKSDPRVGAYGAVDELNSFLGLARDSVQDDSVRARLGVIQNDLFALGAVLATPAGDRVRPRPSVPDVPDRSAEMEQWIDAATAELSELSEFILPGGTRGASLLHVCRTVCRRAERSAVALGETEGMEDGVLPYLNRLSDLLFVWARLDNLRGGEADVVWSKD